MHQGELVKWPKNHSNAAAITALEVLSIRCRPLVMKLHGFPVVVVESGSVSLSGWVLQVFCNDVESVFSEGVFHAAQPRSLLGTSVILHLRSYLFLNYKSRVGTYSYCLDMPKRQVSNCQCCCFQL